MTGIKSWSSTALKASNAYFHGNLLGLTNLPAPHRLHLKYRKEKMSQEFTKHLFDFKGKLNPFHMVVHHFRGSDKGGPHCHPFRFTTYILKGG
ncbi:hypothetical protein [Spirosoma flavum]|uniref:Uncharacterized protein n=1 Tax=Spirosoma flavum TaxID=2048557 RepID=A0ABW6AQ39_9BACT